MANVKFLYKILRLPKQGGIIPANLNIKVRNHRSFGDYFLAETDISNYWKLRDFYPLPVSDDEFNGLLLHNVTELPIDSTDPESDTRVLTQEELALQAKGNKVLEKLDIRSDIENSVGDIYDIVADLTKLVCLLVNETGSTELKTVVSNYLANYDQTDTQTKLNTRFDSMATFISNYKS